ncbi:unnamed protein product [Paramecium octaurelia]|uniref:Uncharacterized protein n=1 Tax=Paramecium octaurelia TaxID=43137 RepID=A0A8S1YP78_PAROT|nr:unnamed protein product [Paramecium octaurelia]
MLEHSELVIYSPQNVIEEAQATAAMVKIVAQRHQQFLDAQLASNLDVCQKSTTCSQGDQDAQKSNQIRQHKQCRHYQMNPSSYVFKKSQTQQINQVQQNDLNIFQFSQQQAIITKLFFTAGHMLTSKQT